MTNALNQQIGGSHYKDLEIQPVEYIHANGIGYFEGNVIKYVTRWKSKGGVADLEKAKHYIELLIDLENAHANIHFIPTQIAHDGNGIPFSVKHNDHVKIYFADGQTDETHNPEEYIGWNWSKVDKQHRIVAFQIVNKT